MLVKINGVNTDKISDVSIAPQHPNGSRQNVVYEGILIGDVSDLELGNPFILEFDGNKYFDCRLTNTPITGAFVYARMSAAQ